MPAADVNQALYDLAVSHQIGLQRLSTDAVRKVLKLVDRAEHDVLTKLQAGGTDVSTARLEALLKALRTIMTKAYEELAARLGDSAVELAQYEAEYQAAKITAALPISVDYALPTPEQLAAAVMSRPFQGRILKEWGGDLADAAFKRVRDAVRIGYLEGETTGDIVRRIRGTAAAQYADGVTAISRRGAESLVRTALNHTANYAREMTFAKNKDLIKSVRWVSTLDARTSAICRARDGEVFPVGEGPRPPAHWNAVCAGGLVSTTRGSVPVEDVRVGDMVITHRGRLRRVYATMSKVEKVNIRSINLSTGRVLRVTDEHPVLVGGLGWQHADQIKVGHQLFQDPKSVGQSHGARRARADEPHQYPADFDEREIFTSVCQDFSSVTVLPVVDLEPNLVTQEREIQNARADDVLMYGSAARTMKKILNDKFVRIFSAKLLFVDTLHRLAEYFRYLGRVSLEHTLAVTSHNFAGLFGGPPVRVCLASSLGGEVFSTDGRPSSLVPVRNAVYPARRAEVGVSVVVQPSHRTLFANMQTFDDIEHESSVVEPSILHGAHWLCPTVTGIDTVQSKEKVYNLAVEEDETFLVEGVIVHNCRSTTVAVTKSWKELGINLPDLPASTRASMNGQVPATETYQTWLARQPVSVQNDVLGPTRAGLFRKGGVTLDRFVDNAGNQLNIAQLRKRDADAFAAAGL